MLKLTTFYKLTTKIVYSLLMKIKNKNKTKNKNCSRFIMRVTNKATDILKVLA